MSDQRPTDRVMDLTGFVHGQTRMFTGDAYPARGLINDRDYAGVSMRRMSGETVVDSLMGMVRDRPLDRDLSYGYVPRLQIQDVDINAPMRSFNFSDAKVPESGLLRALKQSSAQSAAELVTRGRVSGWFVMTDQHRAAFTDDVPGSGNKLMTSRGVLGAVYGIRGRRTANGMFELTAIPQGFGKQLTRTNTWSATLEPEIAERFLSAFRPVESDYLGAGKLSFSPRQLGRIAKTQNALIEHDRVLRALDRLKDPAAFQALLSGTTPAIGLERGLNLGFASSSRRRLDTILAPFTSTHNAAAQALHNSFKQSIAQAWKRTHGDAPFAGPEFEAFYRNKWEMFINPVLSRAQAKVNSPVGGPVPVRALRGDIFAYRGGLFAAMKERAAELGIGTQAGVQSLLAHDTDPNANIRKRLAQLDELEAANPLHLHVNGKVLKSERVAAYERFVERVEAKIIKPSGGKLRAEFRFQDAQPFLGQGYGVTANIVRADTPYIRAGDLKSGAQLTLPIVDLEGYYTTAGGQRLRSRGIAISGRVWDRAKVATWNQSLEIVSQGFHFAKRRLSFGKGLNATYLFSAQQSLMAGVDKRMDRIASLIHKNRFDRATNEFSLGLKDIQDLVGVTGSDYQIDRQWGMGFSAPDQFMADPYNFKAMKKDWINQGALKKFAQGQFVGGSGGTYGFISAEQKRIRDGLLAEMMRNGMGRGDAEALLREHLAQSIGGSMGYAQEHTVRARLDAGKLIRAFHGVAAANDDVLMPMAFFENVLPGGVANVRPTQHLKSIKLGEFDREDAHTAQLLRTDGWEDFTDPRYGRNMRTGFVIGGQMLEQNEHGEWVPAGEKLDADATMQRLGVFEQQMLLAKDAEDVFRPGADMLEAKLMADMSKGTVQVAGVGNKISWDAASGIELISGVPFAKTIDKHESLTTFQRGFFQRVLAQPGASRGRIAEKLRAMQYDVEETLAGMLKVKLNQGQLLPTLGEIEELAQMAGLDMAKDVDFTLADGKTRMRVSLGDALLHTRVIADTAWDTKLSMKERISGTWRRKPLGARTKSGSMGAIDIMRLAHEGLFGHAENITLATFKAKWKGGDMYALGQHLGAYLYNFGEKEDRALASRLGVTKRTMADMVTAGRHEPVSMGRLTRSEYGMRYEKGMIAVNLGREIAIDKDGKNPRSMKWLMIPDVPAKPTNGVFRPSDVQRAADEVIQAVHGGDDDEAAKALTKYKSAMERELAGKSGLIAKNFKKMQFSGLGMGKGPLAQSMWVVGDNAMKPFEARISREMAEIIGAVDPHGLRVPYKGNEGETARYLGWGSKAEKGSTLADWRAGNEARGFFYGSIHRDPQVVPGRMGAKIVIDNELKGSSIYVHDSLREALIGDSDGDKIRIIQAGPLEGINLNKQQIGVVESQFEAEVAAKADYWNQWNAHRGLKRGTMLEDLGKGGVFGYIRSFLKGDEAKADRFLPRTEEQLASMVMQRRVAAAQGIMGSVVDPLQAFAMQRELEAARVGDHAGAAHWNMTNRGWGWIREEILKVKSKGEFDPFAVASELRASGSRGTISSPEGLTIDDLHDIAFNKQARKNGEALAGFDPEGFFKVFDENFVHPLVPKQNEDGTFEPWDPEKQAKYRRYTAARDMIGGLRAEMGDNFFDSERFKIHAGTIAAATANNTSDYKLLPAGRELASYFLQGDVPQGYQQRSMIMLRDAFGREMDESGPQVSRRTLIPEDLGVPYQAGKKPMAQHWAGYIDQKLGTHIDRMFAPKSLSEQAADIMSLYAQQRANRAGVSQAEISAALQEALAPARGIPAVPSAPEIANSLINETSKTTAGTIEAVAEQSARDTMEAVTRNKPARWALAALGAGAVLGVGAFVTGGGSSNPPEMPSQGGSEPPARVMSTDPGGSNESYNIQVRAKSSKDGDQSYESALYGVGLGHGSLTVNVRDSRTGIAGHMHRHFTDQIKGR